MVTLFVRTQILSIQMMNQVTRVPYQTGHYTNYLLVSSGAWYVHPPGTESRIFLSFTMGLGEQTNALKIAPSNLVEQRMVRTTSHVQTQPFWVKPLRDNRSYPAGPYENIRRFCFVTTITVAARRVL